MASLREVGFESGKMTGRRRMRGHLAHCFFGESSGLTGHSDEDRRLRMADYIQQCDLSIRLSPALHFLFFARVRYLLGSHVLAIFRNEAVAIDSVEAGARFCFRDASCPE